MKNLLWLIVVIGFALVGAFVYAGFRDAAPVPFLIAVVVLSATAYLAHLLTRKDSTHEAIPSRTDRPEDDWMSGLPPTLTEDSRGGGGELADVVDNDLRLPDASMPGGQLHGDPLAGLTLAGRIRRSITVRDNEIFVLREALRQLDGYGLMIAGSAQTDGEAMIGRTIVGITRPHLRGSRR